MGGWGWQVGMVVLLSHVPCSSLSLVLVFPRLQRLKFGHLQGSLGYCVFFCFVMYFTNRYVSGGEYGENEDRGERREGGKGGWAYGVIGYQAHLTCRQGKRGRKGPMCRCRWCSCLVL